MTAGRDLGFAGLVAAGHTPQEAWQSIRDDLARNPDACAIFTELESEPSGRAALDCARAAWARHGLPAPFDNLPEQPGATP